MSRSTKVTIKKSKKSVKNVVTEMDIIDGINKGDLTGLVNENNVNTVINIYSKIKGSIDAKLIANAITNNKCAEIFYNFIKSFDYKTYNIRNYDPKFLLVSKNCFGENIILDNTYNIFLINKILSVSSLDHIISYLCSVEISKINILHFLKKNFMNNLIELNENAEYDKVVNSIDCNVKSCSSYGYFGVSEQTAIILRMFNANPK